MLIAVTGLVINASVNQEKIYTAIANEGYELTFNQETNVLTNNETSSSGDTTIQTTLNNTVDFAYNNVYQTAGNWQSLSQDGEIYNTTAITGIKNIEISIQSPFQFLVIYSGHRNFSEYEFKTYAGSNSGLRSYTISFDSLKPNYFKIINTRQTALNIINLEISYSCIDEYLNIKDHPTVNEEYNFGFYPQTLEVDNAQGIANNAKIANNLLNGYVIYSNNL